MLLFTIISFTIYAAVVWLITLPAFIRRIRQPGVAGNQKYSAIVLFLCAPLVIPFLLCLGLVLLALAGLLLAIVVAAALLAGPVWLLLKLVFLIIDMWMWVGEKVFLAEEKTMNLLTRIEALYGKGTSGSANRSKTKP